MLVFGYSVTPDSLWSVSELITISPKQFSLARRIFILRLRLLWGTKSEIGRLDVTIPNSSKIVVAHGGKSQRKSKHKRAHLTPPASTSASRHLDTSDLDSDCVIRLLIGPEEQISCDLLRTPSAVRSNDSLLTTYIRAYYRTGEGTSFVFGSLLSPGALTYDRYIG